MSDRDDLFVRGGNGTVIGVAIEGHPDSSPDADVLTFMIPIVPIPESATIGPLPDVVEQANELASANARIADLEARLSAASGGPAAQTPEQRIAELEAELEARNAAPPAAADPAPSSSSSPFTPPSAPSSSSSPTAVAPVVAEVPAAPSAPAAPSWQELAGGTSPAADPTA